jgi:soluble lytic murein transglycosylase-like protein
MRVHPRLCGLGWALAVAGILACRPAAVNEAAQRVHPAVNVVQGPSPADARAVAADARGPAAPTVTDPAALLAAGQPEPALAALAQQPAAALDSWDWWVSQALRARAERLRGRPEQASATLAPLVAARRSPPGLPRELIADEYARSLMAQAATLPQREADALRRTAAKVWHKASKLEPVRNLASMRVGHAEALAAIEGEGAGRRAAATAAVKALGDVVKAYPAHPRRGTLELARALALQRAGKQSEAIAALRRVAIEQTGAPEADSAEQTLVGLGRAPRWSGPEQLERASAARSHRRFDASRQILDELLRDPRTPAHLRPLAQRSRAYTASKQRDFATYAADLEALFRASPSADLRGDLLRALDRAGRHQDAIDLWLTQAQRRGAAGTAALSQAIEQAMRGGLYGQARTLFERLPPKDRLRGDRPWIDAWLKLRLGERDAAIQAFAALERRRGEQAGVARYFRGRLLLASPEDRAEGVSLLRAIVAAGPLDYYGLMARQRLLDAGEEPGPVPVLSPMSTETADPPTPAQARATFAALVSEHGAAIPALRRGEFLYAAGWWDEAQRELRIAVDTLELVAPLGKSGWVPRHEDHVRGLAWLATWKQPKLAAPREARALRRDADAVAGLREGLRGLCWALGEPHRLARLTTGAAGSYRARWHPRAYRATVEREAAARAVDPTQLWALMYTESRFRRHAVSSVGARGAIQIMPNTGELLAARLGESLGDTDRLFDIDTNVHLAAYYLAELLRKFHGQPAMAYASYNGGPFNVERWLRAKADPAGGGQPLELDVFIAEIPFRETANYTRRVLEVQAAYSLLYRGELPRWVNAIDPQVEANIDF